MKGTIDQVDAFFTSISSVWSRIAAFFVTCWAAHLFGSAAARFTWSIREGLTWLGPRIGYDVHLLPVSWLSEIIGGAANISGLAVLLSLVAIAYLMVFTDVPRLLLVTSAFAIQTWTSWFRETPEVSVDLWFIGSSWEPVPGLLLMCLITGILLVLAVYSWCKTHPSDED